MFQRRHVGLPQQPAQHVSVSVEIKNLNENSHLLSILEFVCTTRKEDKVGAFNNVNGVSVSLFLSTPGYSCAPVAFPGRNKVQQHRFINNLHFASAQHLPKIFIGESIVHWKSDAILLMSNDCRQMHGHLKISFGIPY